jgi:hypothetical protein
VNRCERCRGQAAVEALAAIPLLVLAVLVACQLIVLVRGAVIAHEAAREKALAATGSGIVTVAHRQAIPGTIPGLRSRLELRVETRIRGR